MDKEIVLVAHNIRSTHNVGSLLRTSDGLGINKVFLTGYTPYPTADNDSRLPHLAAKINSQIHKTALGAEKTIIWQHEPDPKEILDKLKSDGFEIIALEQAAGSHSLNEYKTPDKLALLIGEEVNGVSDDLLDTCDAIVEIPMLGQKESFNVSVAAAIALYRFRFSV